MYFTLKVTKHGVVVQVVRTHSIRRFLKNIRTIKWQDRDIKAYLRVNYGKGFYNNGEYSNEKEFWLAVQAFTETN